ncbi:MAG TPA: DUF2779 domain-containing protein [Verrucomicrobiae bacterium]|nr:DUF2779 domain-containing protein [Verrucomicrobiae bacterium]
MKLQKQTQCGTLGHVSSSASSSYLTKSDFIVARTCPTKLYYKKMRYPSLLDDDPYMEFLADGGYMVEKMAKLLYPDGREIGDWDNPEKTFADTKAALSAANCTLFEATVISGRLLARHDILERFGKTLRLIEIKSTSVDTVEDGENPFRGARGGIDSGWRPYLEDVTFQVVVLRRAFPGYEIIPYLCVVDKAKESTINSTFDKFQLRRGEGPQGRFRPRVDYTGDAARLPKEHVLAILNVADEVAELENEISASADMLAATLTKDSVIAVEPVIGKNCKHCEYRVETSPSGFKECWGKLADPDPHILDLYRIDLAGGKSADLPAQLAAQGKAALADVPEEILSGATAERQKVQLEYTAKNCEFIDPDLKRILKAHKYPLHFIDFEASRLAIPYHTGMRPYEIAAFQWSCHSVSTPGGQLEHGEWLNDVDAFPNFSFARSLKEQIGNEGTVYIWSPYELVVLREIRRQMDDYRERDPALAAWLDRLTAKGNSRVMDLCELTKRYYFHPLMKGSLSIKYVLPAVWEADAELRADPMFAQYVGYDSTGKLLDPYATLPPLPIGEKEEVIREGTGAIRLYQEMMFGVSAADAEARKSYRKLLFQYCGLDTAAMVMIWRHWMR